MPSCQSESPLQWWQTYFLLLIFLFDVTLSCVWSVSSYFVCGSYSNGVCVCVVFIISPIHLSIFLIATVRYCGFVEWISRALYYCLIFLGTNLFPSMLVHHLCVVWYSAVASFNNRRIYYWNNFCSLTHWEKTSIHKHDVFSVCWHSFIAIIVVLLFDHTLPLSLIVLFKICISTE